MADLVIQGRVLDQKSEPLPQKAGEILLGSLWTYKISVVRVIRGQERSPEITAMGESDPALRKDRDIVFYLSRRDNGTYHVDALATPK